MIQLTYTDSDRVLGVVGLTFEDLSDEFFEKRDLTRILSVELFLWLPTHSTIYIDPAMVAPTAQAQFNSDCLTLYCTYFCASKILDAALSIPIKETDGVNEYNRFASIDLRALSKDINSQATYYRQVLLTAISSANVSVAVAQSTVITPTYDPVTG